MYITEEKNFFTFNDFLNKNTAMYINVYEVKCIFKNYDLNTEMYISMVPKKFKISPL